MGEMFLMNRMVDEMAQWMHLIGLHPPLFLSNVTMSCLTIFKK